MKAEDRKTLIEDRAKLRLCASLIDEALKAGDDVTAVVILADIPETLSSFPNVETNVMRILDALRYQ